MSLEGDGVPHSRWANAGTAKTGMKSNKMSLTIRMDNKRYQSHKGFAGSIKTKPVEGSKCVCCSIVVADAPKNP